MVQRSVVAFLDHDAFRRAVERFRLVVAEAGGETLALRAQLLGEMDATTLTVAWNAARSAEYAELQAECGKFLEEIAHAAPGAEQAGRALARAQEELERYSTAVFEHTHL